jgi:hypothetical protein
VLYIKANVKNHIPMAVQRRSIVILSVVHPARIMNSAVITTSEIDMKAGTMACGLKK